MEYNTFIIIATPRIDNLYVTVPANVIAHIGLTSHSSDTEAGTTSESEAGTPNQETSKLVELDPERTKYAEVMICLWNTLSKMPSIESLGLCDVETDVFKRIYNEVQIKPKNVQVSIPTTLFNIFGDFSVEKTINLNIFKYIYIFISLCR